MRQVSQFLELFHGKNLFVPVVFQHLFKGFPFILHAVVFVYGFPVNLQVTVLPLSRCVIHKRDLLDEMPLNHILGDLEGVHIVDLQPEVKPVVDEVAAVLDVGNQFSHFQNAFLGAQRTFPQQFIAVQGKRVVDGGDAQLQKFFFAFFQCQLKGKSGGGTWEYKLFDFVGMHVNHARQNVPAVGIDGLFRYAVTRTNGCDAVVVQPECFPGYHAVRGDDFSVFYCNHSFCVSL